MPNAINLDIDRALIDPVVAPARVDVVGSGARDDDLEPPRGSWTRRLHVGDRA